MTKDQRLHCDGIKKLDSRCLKMLSFSWQDFNWRLTCYHDILHEDIKITFVYRYGICFVLKQTCYVCVSNILCSNNSFFTPSVVRHLINSKRCYHFQQEKLLIKKLINSFMACFAQIRTDFCSFHEYRKIKTCKNAVKFYQIKLHKIRRFVKFTMFFD